MLHIYIQCIYIYTVYIIYIMKKQPCVFQTHSETPLSFLQRAQSGVRVAKFEDGAVHESTNNPRSNIRVWPCRIKSDRKACWTTVRTIGLAMTYCWHHSITVIYTYVIPNEILMCLCLCCPWPWKNMCAFATQQLPNMVLASMEAAMA